MTYNFTPFPILETNRLVLRQVVPSDVAQVFEMRSDPEVMKYIPRPIAQTHDDALALITMMQDFIDKNEKINWAMALKETNELIGMAGFVNIKPEHFRAEIGYSLRGLFHRNGYMQEAVRRIMQYGFEQMNLNSMEAIVDEENEASAKLLESIGFRREARFVEDFFHNEKFRNSIHYGILQSEFRAGDF